MSSLNELYQEVIIDHGRRPRNFAVSVNANCVQEGFNPLCGDRLTVYVTEDNGRVTDVTFQGSGCAISMASASLMTETIKGKTVADTHLLFTAFHQLLTTNTIPTEETSELLGKLRVLAGVAQFPARVKCATLAWHTLLAALNHDKNIAKTE